MRAMSAILERGRETFGLVGRLPFITPIHLGSVDSEINKNGQCEGSDRDSQYAYHEY